MSLFCSAMDPPYRSVLIMYSTQEHTMDLSYSSDTKINKNVYGPHSLRYTHKLADLEKLAAYESLGILAKLIDPAKLQSKEPPYLDCASPFSPVLRPCVELQRALVSAYQGILNVTELNCFISKINAHTTTNNRYSCSGETGYCLCFRECERAPTLSLDHIRNATLYHSVSYLYGDDSNNTACIINIDFLLLTTEKPSFIRLRLSWPYDDRLLSESSQPIVQVLTST
jgi:hypothetical protein